MAYGSVMVCNVKSLSNQMRNAFNYADLVLIVDDDKKIIYLYKDRYHNNEKYQYIDIFLRLGYSYVTKYV